MISHPLSCKLLGIDAIRSQANLLVQHGGSAVLN
jgi:hypothetical protein